jgi:gamma-glutamyl phosphate reductase
MSYIKEMGKKAKAASYVIQSLTSKKKNEILEGVADGLLASKDEIFKSVYRLVSSVWFLSQDQM